MLWVNIFNFKQVSFTLCTLTLKLYTGNPDVNHTKFRQVWTGLWLVTSSANPTLVLQSTATITTPAARAVQWQHSMTLWRSIQGPTPTPENTVRLNSLQNTWPGTNVIKEHVLPALNPGRFSTAPLQTASGRHIDGCSSWPHDSKRNHNNTQGTKSKTGTLDIKHKSASLLQKVFKLISKIVWKVTAVNSDAFTVHSSSLSHLKWVQIYFPLSTYFSHMLNKCKYFTLFFFFQEKDVVQPINTVLMLQPQPSVHLLKSFINSLNEVSVWPQQTGNFQMPLPEVFLKGYNKRVHQQPCFLHS